MGIESQLVAIAHLFNKNDIYWALGGSSLLYFKGMDVRPRDLDILVDIEDIDRAKDLVESLGGCLLEDLHKGDGTYLTEKFYTFDLHGTEIDLMANPGVQKGLGPYRFTFDKSCIRERIEREAEWIYLSDLREWALYYKFLERPLRVTQISEFLKTQL